ncbi:hypothetical protein BJY16_005714 [Actinoplanes octamycinicus]|uniref:PRC-barrel domain-containing protein n=1 Tax=Actinoplanes octamycinicus TaxID=135948 RepID=A0A7W7H1H8_9ACTN|nr:PRC-barrel domain-containing protein [Actinoplanes octamycinicus]MBB4742255.1 hypothetical protein [Actinoplanes octamycinicus]GIE59900.1 hypothetical protein Aoc01nite_53020 [Actinoplanes octamycinicus]
MITLEQVHQLYGRQVHGPDGDMIGTVAQVWDDGVGHPAWAGVRTSRFGFGKRLVPLHDAALHDGRLVVPFTRALVLEAPRISALDDDPLSRADVVRLNRHYRLPLLGRR